jgi:pilus assembly protein Flp/PilA
MEQTLSGGHLLALPLCQGKDDMPWFVTSVKKFVRKEEGASLAEYGLLLALIAVVCIGAIMLLGGNISTMISTLAGSL